MGYSIENISKKLEFSIKKGVRESGIYYWKSNEKGVGCRVNHTK